VIHNVTLGELPSIIARAEGKRKIAIHAAVVEAILLGTEILANEAPKAFGELKQSFHAEPSGDPRTIVADAPHAAAVEFGARPHMAPFAPLLAWAERIGADDPGALAKAVQKKIAEVGSQPTHFIKDSLPKLREALVILVERALNRGE